MKSLLRKSFTNIRIPAWIKSGVFQMIICSIILFTVIHITYMVKTYDYTYDYKINDLVKEDIFLLENYLDVEETQKLKDNVQYDIEEIYTIDGSVYADAKTVIGGFYNQVYDVRAEYAEDEEYRVRVLKYVLKEVYNLTSEELEYLANMDEYDLRLTESYVYDVLKSILTEGVTEENIIQMQNHVEVYFARVEKLDDISKPIINKIANNHVVVNSYVDENATEALIDERISEVKDVIIPAGTVIAKIGEPLDAFAFSIISDAGLNNLHSFDQKKPMYVMDGYIILALIAMMVILNYYYRNRSKKVSLKTIYMSFTIVFFTYLVSFGFGEISIYLLPIAAAGMLISILDDVNTGIIYSFFLTVIFGMVFDLSIMMMTFTLFGAVIASMMVYQVFQRSLIFLAGLVISIIYMLVIAGQGIASDKGVSVILEQVMMGGLSGILCSVITIGSLPLWEQLFKVLTPVKLLEYANPNHPLMKKLLLEAPGTYHHSILVANLSEAAAHDIGSNAIMTRVGAYFHDIGKIDKPFLFVENQYDGQNPHDQFVPRVSAKIIKDHVKCGLKLGKQYKLPKEILAFIEQHHGTTMIQYFYFKAKENKGDVKSDFVDKEAYTYKGPVPSTKEIAIVMLADSVEAAVRSIKNPDKQSVADLIHKIIQSKIKDHQLDECDLTLKDIEIVTQSFTSNLSSAFHERIEYPEIEEAEHHINIIK